MKTFRATDNGRRFQAANAADLIDQLRADSRGPTADSEEYMIRTSDIVNEVSGQRVRIETAEAFVADLIAAGVLEEISNEQ